MRTGSEEIEVDNLREEVRHLRALLAGRDQTAELLANTEREIAVQTRELASTREELEQQARLFDTVLSSIVDFAYIFDREGRFTYINQALLDLWQMRLEDAVGKNFFELPYPRDLAARLQAQIETVFRTGQLVRDETPYTGAAGVTRHYEYIFVPVFDKEGQVNVVAGSTRDITQRAQAQAEKEALFRTLQIERQRLNTLFQQAPAFIAVVRGPEHIFEMANPLYLQLVGNRELVGRPVREAFPEIEGQGFFEILDEVYRTGQPFNGRGMPIRFQEDADAPVRERFLDFVYQPLLEADGSVSGIFVHGIDLTERIQAEHALYESQERVRLATEAAGLGIWTWEPDGDGVVWENRRMYEIYGLSPEAPPLTSAQFLAEIVYPDDAQAFARAIAAPVETGAPLYFVGRFYRTDGALRWIEFRGRRQPAAEGERLRVVGTAADVTDRKEAEVSLQESKQSLQLAVEGAQLGTFYCEMPLDKIIWNDTCKEHFFLPPDAEIDFNLFYSRLHPDDREPTRQAIERAMHEHVPYNVEYRTVAPDGRLRWINATGRFYYTTTGEPTRFDGITIDITERKHLELEQARLAAIVNSSVDAVVSKDLHGLVTSWNKAAERIYGWKAEEIIGKSKALVIPPELPDELSNILRRIRTGERIEHYETRRIRKDGTIMDVAISVSPIKDPQGRIVGAATIVRDITERKRIDMALSERTQEVQALNIRLQRAMTETHHRVKNNLQVISALVDVQAGDAGPTVPTDALLRVGQHVKALATIHDLLTKESKENGDVEYLYTGEVLEKLQPLLQAIVGTRRINFQVDDIRLPIRQGTSLAVLINELVSNAVKHGGGEIDLLLRKEADRGQLTVIDRGPGFAPDFDPKREANTGLELIQSLGTWDLGGEVSFENSPEGGACVIVTFPLTAEDWLAME